MKALTKDDMKKVQGGSYGCWQAYVACEQAYAAYPEGENNCMTYYLGCMYGYQ
jgi:urate oxidase